MKTRFAALLLTSITGTACAQTLQHDKAVHALAATRDLSLGQTTITGTYTNTGSATLPAPTITLMLYDENDHEVGRLVEHAEADLPPGATWHIRATTSTVFVHFIAMSPVPASPAAVPTVRLTSTRAPVRKKSAAKKPVPQTAAAPKKQPVPYHKPALYDWSKHRPASAKPAKNANPGAKAGTPNTNTNSPNTTSNPGNPAPAKP
jgi:hypothetical protein